MVRPGQWYRTGRNRHKVNIDLRCCWIIQISVLIEILRQLNAYGIIKAHPLCLPATKDIDPTRQKLVQKVTYAFCGL
jgi:hypothetical protein